MRVIQFSLFLLLSLRKPGVKTLAIMYNTNTRRLGKVEKRIQTHEVPWAPRNDVGVSSLGFLLASYIADVKLARPATWKCQWVQKKRNLQTTIPHKYKYKRPSLMKTNAKLLKMITKQNSATYKKIIRHDQIHGVSLRDTGLVQYLKINHCNSPC